MQSKLEPSQIEAISARYHDHPLLQACRKAFARYEGDMERLLFAPEEIMLEAAIVLDHLLSDVDDALQYIEQLWSSLKVKLRRWDREATQSDLNRIVGAVHYVVAATLCQHIHPFYREQLRNQILDIIRQQMGIDEEEETRIILELSLCAEGLNNWLQTYVESEDMLSEEILNGDHETRRPVLSIGRAIPQPLQGEKAESIKAKLIEANLLDDDWQPIGLSGAEKGVLAQKIAEHLGLQETWQVFGNLWNVKPETLRAAFNRALDQKKTSDFLEKIKKALD